MTNLYKKKHKLHVPEKIVKFIKNKDSVTTKMMMEEFDLSRNSVYSYLSRLENRGELFRVGRGVYITNEKPARIEWNGYRANGFAL